MLDTIFTYAWIFWIASFLVIEGIALHRSKAGDTLSEHVWIWFGTDRKYGRKPTGGVQLRRFILLAFMAWLSVHFLTGGFI